MIDVLERIIDENGNCIGYKMRRDGVVYDVSNTDIRKNWDNIKRECRVDKLEKNYDTIRNKLIKIAFSEKNLVDRVSAAIAEMKANNIGAVVKGNEIHVMEFKQDNAELVAFAKWVYRVVVKQFRGCRAIDISMTYDKNRAGYYPIVVMQENYDIVYDICGHSNLPQVSERFTEICGALKSGRISEYTRELFKVYVETRDKIIEDRQINANRVEYYERIFISNKLEDWDGYNKTYIEQVLRLYRSLKGSIREEIKRLEKFLDEVSNYRQTEAMEKLHDTYNYYFKLA